MPKITYIEANGTEHDVEVPVGVSIMQGAVNHLVPGIEGDCGGLCACGTCHVYVPDEWQAVCRGDGRTRSRACSSSPSMWEVEPPLLSDRGDGGDGRDAGADAFPAVLRHDAGSLGIFRRCTADPGRQSLGVSPYSADSGPAGMVWP